MPVPEWICAASSEAVKPKRGEQAENGFGNALGDLGQRVVLGGLERGEGVQSAPYARQLPPPCQPAHILGVDASGYSF